MLRDAQLPAFLGPFHNILTRRITLYSISFYFFRSSAPPFIQYFLLIISLLSLLKLLFMDAGYFEEWFQ
jgi:hypothetical protein